MLQAKCLEKSHKYLELIYLYVLCFGKMHKILVKL